MASFFTLYFQEHGVPHIQAIYQNFVAVIDLQGELLEGKLPRKKMKTAKQFVVDYKNAIQEMIDDINDSKQGKRKAPKIKNLNKPNE